MQQKTCLTQTDLARRWTISPRTLERWRWVGEGPVYMKIGGRVVYRLDDILAFEQAQLRQNTTSVVGVGAA
jgi:predicted site-specific integrase-resolvase